jgi:hypothetical protein
MTLTHSAIESLFRSGRFEEIAADCTSGLREVLRLATVEHRFRSVRPGNGARFIGSALLESAGFYR